MLIQFKTITPCRVPTVPKGPTGLGSDHKAISLPTAGSLAHNTKGNGAQPGQNPKSTCTASSTDRNLHKHTLYTLISPEDVKQLKLCATSW